MNMYLYTATECYSWLSIDGETLDCKQKIQTFKRVMEESDE